jgi:hypothetical protein
VSHARQQIREALAARVTGLTTCGTRVFQSRMVPQETLPLLLVTTNDEEINPGTIGDIYERVLSVSVIGLAKATANLDDTLDTIAAEVEVAMSAEYWAELVAINVGFDEMLEKPAGRIELVYRVTYRTASSVPGTIL